MAERGKGVAEFLKKISRAFCHVSPVVIQSCFGFRYGGTEAARREASRRVGVPATDMEHNVGGTPTLLDFFRATRRRTTVATN